ncbi:unnamed protein product [Cuscuta campestris]|uniref:Uncharacterized protein n=1 Tax=Cuscuta campestris TaxID=132261 RepID=A0A484LEM2_9ASTE|nr:unnamed protein product [Cuscuta campestris]
MVADCIWKSEEGFGVLNVGSLKVSRHIGPRRRSINLTLCLRRCLSRLMARANLEDQLIGITQKQRYASSASVLGKLHLSGSPSAPHSSVYHTCFTIFIFVQYQWRKNIEISAGDSEGMLTAVRTQWRKNSTLWLGMLAIDSDEKDGSKTTSYS